MGPALSIFAMTGWLRNALRVRPPYAPLVLALLTTGACSDPVECDNVLRSALQVRVVDASGDAVCDVTVRAQGPRSGDEFELNHAGCTFSGGLSDGIYTVFILRGDELLATQRVTVTRDECGTMTKIATIVIPDP